MGPIGDVNWSPISPDVITTITVYGGIGELVQACDMDRAIEDCEKGQVSAPIKGYDEGDAVWLEHKLRNNILQAEQKRGEAPPETSAPKVQEEGQKQ